jgi:hypothetical protein
MAISYQDSFLKFQSISGSNNSNDLTQAKQDINIGYKRFNAAISRYFTRKQAFTDIVANQRYYQIPVDAIRVMSVTVTASTGFNVPLTEVKSERQWREWLIVDSISTSFITHYFVYGNDQIGLYPKPAQTVSQGLRFVYQPQDVDLTKLDYTTGTVAINNGSVALTGTGTSWTAAAYGNMQFQGTDGSDGNFYDIAAINSTTSITLKTPYVGPSVSGIAYRLGQMFIFPGEFNDVPVDYALSRFYESRNNPTRAKYHFDKFTTAVNDAVEAYSSATVSNVIVDGEDAGALQPNPWQWTPLAGA